jgi:hypothetical protein
MKGSNAIRFYAPSRGNPSPKARLTDRWAYLDLGDTTYIRVGLDEKDNIVVQPTHSDDPYAIRYNRKTKAVYIKGLKDTFGINIPIGEHNIEKNGGSYKILVSKRKIA